MPHAPQPTPPLPAGSITTFAADEPHLFLDPRPFLIPLGFPAPVENYSPSFTGLTGVRCSFTTNTLTERLSGWNTLLVRMSERWSRIGQFHSLTSRQNF